MKPKFYYTKFAFGVFAVFVLFFLFLFFSGVIRAQGQMLSPHSAALARAEIHNTAAYYLHRDGYGAVAYRQHYTEYKAATYYLSDNQYGAAVSHQYGEKEMLSATVAHQQYDSDYIS